MQYQAPLAAEPYIDYCGNEWMSREIHTLRFSVLHLALTFGLPIALIQAPDKGQILLWLRPVYSQKSLCFPGVSQDILKDIVKALSPEGPMCIAPPASITPELAKEDMW